MLDQRTFANNPAWDLKDLRGDSRANLDERRKDLAECGSSTPVREMLRTEDMECMLLLQKMEA